MQILTDFRSVIAFPAVGPEPTGLSSAFEIIGDLGDTNGIGIGMRHGGRRLRGDGSTPDRFTLVEVGRFA